MKNQIINGVLLILCFTLTSHSQTIFKHKVKIKIDPTKESLNPIDHEKGNSTIYVIEKEVKNDTLKILKDYTLTKKVTKTHKGLNYELKKDSLINANSNLIFKKSKNSAKKLKLRSGNYDANISVSKDSLLINFWLLINENGNSYYQESKEEEKKKFQINPESKYFMKLKNRQYEKFNYSNYEIGALSIPFKYHYGFKENNQKIDPIFTTNINVNTFFGKRIGKTSYVYDKYEGMKTKNSSITIGGFLGLGAQKIDSISTSLALIPLKKEINVPTLSYGIGAVVNLSDFNLGLFYGWDKTLGEKGGKWNHYKKPWLGFGFGYKIALIGKNE